MRRHWQGIGWLLAAAAAGCGYTLGHDTAGPRRVAIRVVGNQTWRQRLERDLTRALHEALVVWSSMTPLAGGEPADAVLEVTLVDARNRSLVLGRPEPLSEGSLALMASARLLTPDGDPLSDAVFVDRAEFRVAVGETEATAAREAVGDLARKIVLGLEAGF